MVSITGIWCWAMRKVEKAFARFFVDALARFAADTTSVSLTATAMRYGDNASTRGLVRLSEQPATCRST